MGTQIADIVSVNITRETAKLTQVGFGTALILAPSSKVLDRVKTYSDPADLLDDGYLSTDPIYKAALALFSQERSPERFKVGRKYENVNAKQHILFSATPDSGNFKIKLGSVQTAAIAFGASAADVKTALELLVGIAEVTVTGSITQTGLTIEFTGADANKYFGTFEIVENTLLIGADAIITTVSVLQYGSAVETWTQAINNVIAADEDWYCLIASTRIKSEILELAAIIETKIKIFSSCSNDADVLTSATDDIASSLKALNYDKTFYFWSEDQARFPEAAWAYMITEVPGSATWKFKELKGVAPDTLSANDLNHLKNKRANYFEYIAGYNIVSSEAIVASGEYIDVIVGIDWLQVRMAEKVFVTLINSKKVPFTDGGISKIETDVRTQLQEAEDNGIIAPLTSVVKVPLVANISKADKGLRLLDNVKFSGILAGAIHKVKIEGKLSL